MHGLTLSLLGDAHQDVGRKQPAKYSQKSPSVTVGGEPPTIADL
jgi:hypothetical protein